MKSGSDTHHENGTNSEQKQRSNRCTILSVIVSMRPYKAVLLASGGWADYDPLGLRIHESTVIVILVIMLYLKNLNLRMAGARVYFLILRRFSSSSI